MPIDLTRLAEDLRQGLLDAAEPIAASNQGRIYRIDRDGRLLAIKSPVGRGVRGRINRLALDREARAYARLAGLPGIPTCHGLIDRRWLVLDWIEARPLRAAAVGPEYYDRLRRLIEAMHARGVAHGDLKRKANLAVDCEGAPLMLDFGASVLRLDGWHPINRYLFALLRQTDRNAWVKHKYGGYHGVADEDQHWLARSWIERGLARLRRRT